MHKEEERDDVKYFLLFCVDEGCGELKEAFPGISVVVETPFDVDAAPCSFPKMGI